MWAAQATAKIDIPLNKEVIKKGSEITITHGKNEKYALWHCPGIFDIQEGYIENIVQHEAPS